jgi:formylglycine-generating enzyme required for sulfatase activity
MPDLLTITSPIRLELVRIPAGEFLMGSDPAKDKDAYDYDKPQHRIYVAEFDIGKYPVTVAQFSAFVTATDHRTQAEERGYGWVLIGDRGWEQVQGADWRHPRGPKTNIAAKADHPVVQVSWHDAVAFCRWLGQVTGQAFRLLSEAEWEKAARGTDGRIYPWGSQPPDDKRCNFDGNVGDTTAVGTYPTGASPYGALDMAGNVWEWTRSLWGKGWQKPDFGYPYDPTDGREKMNAPDTVWRVLRGGSWYDDRKFVRCACRSGSIPDHWSGNFGFRVARSSR